MKIYPHISIIFIIWFFTLLFISYFGFLTQPHNQIFENNFSRSFANWDGGHFLGIAEFGYSKDFQYAFFPLYPLLINLLTKITQNYLLSAIIISITSIFFGIQFLYKLLTIEFDKKVAEKTIFYLLFFPTSFYFITAYSEGLFFLFTILTFYFLKRRKLLLSVIFASLASATRLAGLALVLGIFVEVIITTGISRKNLYILFALVGFLIYSIYLLKVTGDPFYFLVAEQHWQRSLNFPIFSFWETLKNLSQKGFIISHFNAFLDLVFAIFGVGLSIRSFRFLSPAFSVYFLISVFLPLFTPTLSSIPRFLLPIFPIFILLALMKNKYLIFSYQLISIMLLSIFMIMFINGYWVS